MGGIDLGNTEQCYTLEYIISIHDVITSSDSIIMRSSCIFDNML